MDNKELDLKTEQGSGVEGNILDNAPCRTMIECCCRILEYLEENDNSDDSSLSEAHTHIWHVVFEHLIRIGCDLIIEDSTFNPVRHQAADRQFINPGTPISIKTPGIALQGKVLLKAIVYSKEKIQKQQKIEFRQFPNDNTGYFRLHIIDPYDWMNGIPSSPIYWKHGGIINDEICNGNIYTGDNGTFFCEKCGMKELISSCDFEKPYVVKYTKDADAVKYQMKDIVSGFILANVPTHKEGLKWLNLLCESLMSQEMEENDNQSNK